MHYVHNFKTSSVKFIKSWNFKANHLPATEAWNWNVCPLCSAKTWWGGCATLKLRAVMFFIEPTQYVVKETKTNKFCILSLSDLADGFFLLDIYVGILTTLRLHFPPITELFYYSGLIDCILAQLEEDYLKATNG